MAGTRYFIKTTAGDKGPYSSEQIRELTAQGKLKPTMKVMDATLGHSVSVAEILDGRAKIHAMAVSTNDIAIEEVPGAPSLVPAASGSGSHRTERKSSDLRRNKSRTSVSGRATNDAVGERTGRHSRRKSQSNMLYVAIAVVVVGAAVLFMVIKNANAAAKPAKSTTSTTPAVPATSIAPAPSGPDSQKSAPPAH